MGTEEEREIDQRRRGIGRTEEEYNNSNTVYT